MLHLKRHRNLRRSPTPLRGEGTTHRTPLRTLDRQLTGYRQPSQQTYILSRQRVLSIEPRFDLLASDEPSPVHAIPEVPLTAIIQPIAL
jgi:hypothetical protein